MSLSVEEDPKFGSPEIGALAHLYRGELFRSKIWRRRLDSTTNWAVVTVGIAISVTYASAQASSVPIALVGGVLLIFWFMEARRYRYFDIFRTRVRVMETRFYGPILAGRGVDVSGGWNQVLIDDYAGLYFHITMNEALGRRLRRNYLPIFFVQLAAYLGKLLVHPVPVPDLAAFVSRAAIGPIPGLASLAGCAVFYGGLCFFAVWTLRDQRAVGRAHSPDDHSRRIQELVETELY